MTSKLAVVNGQLVTPSGIESADLTLTDGRIDTIGGLPEDWTGTVIDAQHMLVAPGFIDLQINGGHGIDLTADRASIWRLAELLPQYGVTSFLPTIITSPRDTVLRAQQTLQARPPGFCGAEPLGLHLEGPMLNPKRVGAHPKNHLQLPSKHVIADWSLASGVTMVTVAPELPGALEVISELAARDVTVAAGHSEATADEAADGVSAGVSHVTHLYNAMSGMCHRRPGLVGFALARTDITASIIVDGIHSDPVAVAAAWNAKGNYGLALVTDASAAQGMPDGPYTLGDTAVTVSGNAVRNIDGTLAGTNLTMPHAVRELIRFTGCETTEAIAAATAIPAGIIGAHTKGTIEVGHDADIVLLDQDLQVAMTIIGGRAAYDPHDLTQANPWK